jgi:hypothetical protein
VTGRAAIVVSCLLGACGRIGFSPLGCPPIGTAPVFGGPMHQVTANTCKGYSASTAADLAVTACASMQARPEIEAGPIDQPFAPTGIAPLNGFVNLAYAHIVPEGDHLYVTENNFDALGDDEYADYVRAGSSWSYVGILGIPPSTGGLPQFLGTLTFAPRHVMVNGCEMSQTCLIEWVEQPGGSWQALPAYAPSDLGLPDFGAAANLTSDGLRVVIASGAAGLYYADRPTIDARFTPAVLLPGAPAASEATLADDCSRLYVTPLGQGPITYLEPGS